MRFTLSQQTKLASEPSRIFQTFHHSFTVKALSQANEKTNYQMVYHKKSYNHRYSCFLALKIKKSLFRKAIAPQTEAQLSLTQSFRYQPYLVEPMWQLFPRFQLVLTLSTRKSKFRPSNRDLYSAPCSPSAPNLFGRTRSVAARKHVQMQQNLRQDARYGRKRLQRVVPAGASPVTEELPLRFPDTAPTRLHRS